MKRKDLKQYEEANDNYNCDYDDYQNKYLKESDMYMKPYYDSVKWLLYNEE